MIFLAAAASGPASSVAAAIPVLAGTISLLRAAPTAVVLLAAAASVASVAAIPVLVETISLLRAAPTAVVLLAAVASGTFPEHPIIVM
jgi:hypothetical protein